MEKSIFDVMCCQNNEQYFYCVAVIMKLNGDSCKLLIETDRKSIQFCQIIKKRKEIMK